MEYEKVTAMWKTRNRFNDGNMKANGPGLQTWKRRFNDVKHFTNVNVSANGGHEKHGYNVEMNKGNKKRVVDEME